MKKEFFSPGPFCGPLLAAAILFSCAGSLFATVTIEVCYSDPNLANGSIAVLVADVNEDGFLSPSDASAVGTLLSSGQAIGGSDDLILHVFQAENGAHWSGAAGILETIEALDYTSLGIAPGTDLILYTFPGITQLGASLALGDEVNVYRNTQAGGSGGDMPFEAPADSGVYTLAALPPTLGGTFDSQNPGGSEVFETEAAGLPGGSGGVGDDHGNSRSNPTLLTSGQGATGGLTPGDLDYFSVMVSGLSRITAYSAGSTDTIGYLYAPDGSAANAPAEDDDAGEGNNFRSVGIVAEAGVVTLAVRGKDDNQTGDYEVFLEVESVLPYRTDLTIGTSASTPLGDGIYSAVGAGQSVRTKLKKAKASFTYFKGQNDGGFNDSILFSGTSGNKNFKVTYVQLTDPGGNVTAALTAGRYMSDLSTGEEALFRVQTKPTSRVKKKGRGAMNLSIRASSDEGGMDLGRSKVIVKVKKKKKR